MIRKCILALAILLSISMALAHSESKEPEQPGRDYTNPVLYIIATATLLVLVAIYLLSTKPPKNKKLFFFLIAVPVVLSSLYLAGYTLYENMISLTGGPVHWHADYQVWACGKKLDLASPQGLTNRIGSPLFHEHDDGRMHIEGTVVNWEGITLGEYFETIGGELAEGHLTYPTDEAVYDYENGELCADGSVGSIHVFVNGKRVADYEDYLIYPDSRVPPGDCIIITFDGTDAATTDILCDTWAVQGWNYHDYKRRAVTLGGYTWQ